MPECYGGGAAARGSRDRQRGYEVNTFVAGAVSALLLVAMPVAAHAEDLTFMLTNTSSMAVKAFFTSPVEVEQWEEDVFGDGVLPSGNQVPITIADGRDVCVYDMKFVMENDTEVLEQGIDLCQLGEYTLSDAE